MILQALWVVVQEHCSHIKAPERSADVGIAFSGLDSVAAH